MTPPGIIHLISALYLSGVLCLAVSLNENRKRGRIGRETLRRWGKFAAICFITGLAIYMIG
jgi:hypothetical protein